MSHFCSGGPALRLRGGGPHRDGAGKYTRRWRRGAGGSFVHSSRWPNASREDARPRGWAATAAAAVVPRTPTRNYHASPALESGPRAKKRRAAVPDIFELSGLAVCRAATRVPGIPPEHSSSLGRSVGLTSAPTKTRTRGQAFASSLHAVACERAAFSVCSHVPRVVFHAAPAWTAKHGSQTKLQAQLQPLLQRLAHRLPAGPRRRKHRSARLKKRTRASDDGRARQCRAASPHRRGGHG